MKTRTKTVVLSIAIIILLICVCGCVKNDPTYLNTKVATMIDFDVEHDAEGAYALLYPGVTDFDTFRSTANQIYEYFPVTSEYELELTAWDITKGFGSETEISKGQYRVEFDGNIYIIQAIWRSDKNGCGFSEFFIISEEDWAASQDA